MPDTKRISLMLAVLIAFGALSACSDSDVRDGSGNLTTSDYALRDFTAVAAESGFRVRLEPDTAFDVAVTTDDNLTDDVLVYSEDETLHLKVKPNRDVSFTALHADVRMPQVFAVVLAAGAHCELGSGFVSARPVSFVLAAGSFMDGWFESGDISCVLTAGSRLTLQGNGGNGSLVASAGSTLDLRSYVLTNVTVTADGGSRVYVRASGRLNVTASGGSAVYYLGDPELGDISVSGGSTFRRLN